MSKQLLMMEANRIFSTDLSACVNQFSAPPLRGAARNGIFRGRDWRPEIPQWGPRAGMRRKYGDREEMSVRLVCDAAEDQRRIGAAEAE